MGLTTIVMVIVIVWAVRNIAGDLGITSAVSKRIHKNKGNED